MIHPGAHGQVGNPNRIGWDGMERVTSGRKGMRRDEKRGDQRGSRGIRGMGIRGSVEISWDQLGRLRRRRPKGMYRFESESQGSQKRPAFWPKIRLEQDQRDIDSPSPLPALYGRAQKKTPQRGPKARGLEWSEQQRNHDDGRIRSWFACPESKSRSTGLPGQRRQWT